MDKLKPAPPKCWCNKCGRLLVPSPVIGEHFWINSGVPKFWKVTLTCPLRQTRWFIFTSEDKEHTEVHLHYPTDDNDAMMWYLLQYAPRTTSTGYTIGWKLKDRQEWTAVGKADKLDSFLATGERNKDEQDR